jgi:hypothetical protein
VGTWSFDRRLQKLITKRLPSVTTRLHGSLHIIADRYEDGYAKKQRLGEQQPADPQSTATSSAASLGGHFERMIDLGEDSSGVVTKADYNGRVLTVRVRKKRKWRYYI